MNRSYFKKGFTLIELLVVVGILAVLAIAALIAINPVDAQRRARDSARLEDMARLTSAIEAYINDNGSTTLANANTTAAALVGVRSQGANISWLNTGALVVDLRPYLKQVPLDPSNGRQVSIVPSAGARVARTAQYSFAINTATGDYEFCTYLESDRNLQLLNDGGTAAKTNVFETGVGTGNVDCSTPN